MPEKSRPFSGKTANRWLQRDGVVRRKIEPNLCGYLQLIRIFGCLVI